MDIICNNQAETEQIAAALALKAVPGDLFALSGDLGAGKSTFARAFIRTLLGDMEAEVPSPTFTLVQSYSADFEIYHTDLYRLEDPEEVYDLGLDEERDSSVILVEWPDRMPEDWWLGAIKVSLKREGEITDAGDERRRLRLIAEKEKLIRLSAGIPV